MGGLSPGDKDMGDHIWFSEVMLRIKNLKFNLHLLSGSSSWLVLRNPWPCTHLCASLCHKHAIHHHTNGLRSRDKLLWHRSRGLNARWSCPIWMFCPHMKARPLHFFECQRSKVPPDLSWRFSVSASSYRIEFWHLPRSGWMVATGFLVSMPASHCHFKSLWAPIK